jgi:hypothetical protein
MRLPGDFRMARDLLAAATVLTCCMIRLAGAADLVLTRQSRPVTVDEIAAGAPLGGLVHDFFISADSDILSIGNVAIDVPLFRDSLGSDAKTPSDGLAALSASLSAHSFITTPGDTIVLGGGFDNLTPDSMWGDLSDDGPQQNFHFARLTVNQSGSFHGNVAVHGYDAPVYLPFQFTLPGLADDIARLADEPAYSLTYSLDPPPPPVYQPPALPAPSPLPPLPGPLLPAEPSPPVDVDIPPIAVDPDPPASPPSAEEPPEPNDPIEPSIQAYPDWPVVRPIVIGEWPGIGELRDLFHYSTFAIDVTTIDDMTIVPRLKQISELGVDIDGLGTTFADGTFVVDIQSDSMTDDAGMQVTSSQGLQRYMAAFLNAPTLASFSGSQSALDGSNHIPEPTAAHLAIAALCGLSAAFCRRRPARL